MGEPVPHPPLLVLGYSEAAMFLRHPAAQRVKAVLSIHGRREHPADAPSAARRLILQFDDEDVPEWMDPADPVAFQRCWTRRKWAAENGLSLAPPTREDARAILDFARSIQDLDGVLLCQCQAGVSRSSAAALLCLAAWTGPGSERECVEELLRVRPCANPHPGLVAFGDVLLGRDGYLRDAVRVVRAAAGGR